MYKLNFNFWGYNTHHCIAKVIELLVKAKCTIFGTVELHNF